MSDPQLLQLEDSEPEAPERYDWPRLVEQLNRLPQSDARAGLGVSYGARK